MRDESRYIPLNRLLFIRFSIDSQYVSVFSEDDGILYVCFCMFSSCSSTIAARNKIFLSLSFFTHSYAHDAHHISYKSTFFLSWFVCACKIFYRFFLTLKYLNENFNFLIKFLSSLSWKKRKNSISALLSTPLQNRKKKVFSSLKTFKGHFHVNFVPFSSLSLPFFENF